MSGGQQPDSGRTSQVFQPLDGDDPTTIAGYRLAARLGAGGMGKVYLSYTPGGRPVAIKVIRPEFGEDAEFRRRFTHLVTVQGLSGENSPSTYMTLDLTVWRNAAFSSS